MRQMRAGVRGAMDEKGDRLRRVSEVIGGEMGKRMRGVKKVEVVREIYGFKR